MTELNDELLVAYVDGQLAAAQSKAIERVLEEDAIAAERVAALKAANEHLETAFEAMIAGQPIPVPADQVDGGSKLTATRRITGLIRRSAAFVWVGLGCLLAGAAAGFSYYDTIVAEPAPAEVAKAPEPAQPAPVSAEPVVTASIPTTWAGDMIVAHSMLSAQTFTLGLESEGNLDLTGFQISKILGTAMHVPDLSKEGLTFQRAQMLQREGKPFAQIAYLGETGDPIALYATARTEEAIPMRLGDHNDIGFVTWSQGEVSMLLAGNIPEDRLGQIARAIEHDFNSRQPVTSDTGSAIPQEQPETVGGPDEPAADGAATAN